MDTTQLLGLAGAAIGGMLVGAAASYWYLSQVAAQLQQRLERAELVRNGEIERATKARAQIAQLSQAITELRRAHHTHATPDPDHAERQQPLSRGQEHPPVLPHREPLQAFADTQVMA